MCDLRFREWARNISWNLGVSCAFERPRDGREASFARSVQRATTPHNRDGHRPSATPTMEQKRPALVFATITSAATAAERRRRYWRVKDTPQAARSLRAPKGNIKSRSGRRGIGYGLCLIVVILFVTSRGQIDFTEN